MTLLVNQKIVTVSEDLKNITVSSTGSVGSVAGKVGVVTLVKADVGLGNVDNTTDLLKPISTATQTALDLKVSKDSDTGAAFLPSGTTAQRPVLVVDGYIRYNSDLLGMEAYAHGVWTRIESGAAGGLTDKVFQENDQVVNNSYIIGVGKNASSVGPITINTAINVTISTGGRWVIL